MFLEKESQFVGNARVTNHRTILKKKKKKKRNSHVRRNYIATYDVHSTIGIKRVWGENSLNRVSIARPYTSQRFGTAALAHEFTD